MKKMFSLAICAAVISWTGQAMADSWSVGYDNTGTVYTTTGLTSYQTQGNEMLGMAFTFYFTDGSSQTATWTNFVGNSSGVTITKGNDTFSMTMADTADTYTATWSTTSDISGISNSLSIDKILIDAGAGNTVFDTILTSEYTPGSSTGREFSVSSFGYGYDIQATYSGQVALNGTVYGDLYRYLTIDFVNGAFGPADLRNRTWRHEDFINFVADTDNLKITGDLKPIPEPTTMLLFGTGLIGLAAASRRRK